MIKGLHHNAYRCRDSEETRKFYEDFLGLPLVNAFKIETTQTGRKTGAGVLHSFFQLDDGSCLAFFEAPDMPFEFKEQHDFDLHIALEVEPDALDKMFAKGKADGREVRGVSDHKFIRSIYFRDPNGYVIELTAKVPGMERDMDPKQNHAREILNGWQAEQRQGESGLATRTTEEAMKRGVWGALVALMSAVAFSSSSVAADPPQFQVDPFWPKPLPNNWLLGQVASVAVGARRPCLAAAAAALAHRRRERRDAEAAAQQVLRAGAVGHGVRRRRQLHPGLGLPETTPWVRQRARHPCRQGGLRLDRRQRRQRQRHLQVHQGRQAGADHRQAGTRPAAATTPPCSAARPTSRSTTDASEVYVADGYGNRRVIVFDSETGAYKRHWGAYGNKPNDDKQPAYDPAAPPSQQFANPVHCAKPSKDGHVYVCDRTNNRIQVFKKDGTFVTEWFYDKSTLGAGAVWDLNFWPDANQTWLFNIDGENNLLRILQRSDGKVVGGFGRSGRHAGHFHWVHSIAVDSKGNIYTGEVDNGKRVQKFKPNAAP